MNLRQRIREMSRDSLLYGLSSSLGQLVALLLVPYYSEAFSPQEYGVLAMSAMLAQFSAPVLSLGLDNALFRFFSMTDSDAERRGYVTTAAILKNGFTALCLLVLFACYPLLNSFLFDGNLSRSLFGLVLMSILASSVGAVAEVIIRAQRKPQVLLAIHLPNLIFGTLLSVWWVLWLDWGIFGALLAGLVGQLYAALAYTMYIRRHIAPRAFSKSVSRELLHYALPYVPHRIQGQVMQLFPVFMVGQHMGVAAAGVYSLAGKFVKPLNLVVDSVQKAWVPYKFQVHKQATEPAAVFRRLIGNYWLALLLLWGVACAVFPPVFRNLVDTQYHAGIPYFPFLAFMPVAQAFYYTATVGVELGKNQKILPQASFFGMLTVVALSLLTAQSLAPYGFVAAYVASFFVMTAVVYRRSQELIRVDFPFVAFVLLTAVAIAATAAGYRAGHELLGLQIGLWIAFGAVFFLVFKKLNPRRPPTSEGI